MKILQAIVMVSSGVAGMALLGCDVDVNERSHHRQPVYVEQQQEPTYVIVTEAPPEQRIVELRPAPPSREYVWIDGYYSWGGRQYVWEPGRWEAPPRAHARWIGPRWTHRRGGWAFREGRWR